MTAGTEKDGQASDRKVSTGAGADGEEGEDRRAAAEIDPTEELDGEFALMQGNAGKPFSDAHSQ